ncbi:MAG: hypothetical protein IKL16_00805 [Clostridia bacterium]|nr:hypothetical protein [Clostridia bacterium]
MIFSEMSSALRAVFLICMFVPTALDMCVLPSVFMRKNNETRKILLLLIIAVNSVFLTFYTSLHYMYLYDIAFSPAWEMLAGKSVVLPILASLVNIIFLCYLIWEDRRFRRTSISHNSVKESLDNLPTGLCFSNPNGMVRLSNYRMNSLSHIIAGEELQDAKTFFEQLKNGKVEENVECLSGGDEPVFRISDGTVWMFSRKEIDEETVQLTAIDITSLYNLSEDLRDKNRAIEGMNNRLRKYGETVDSTTRAKERLETKIRIHNSMGQALLTTRHCLNLPNTDFQFIIDMWKKNISVLRPDGEYVEAVNPLESLIKAGEFAGVNVEIKGSLPDDDRAVQLFVLASAEALTNAVRHAEAKNLYVDFYEKHGVCYAEFTNDGDVPEKEIAECGGLGSLRSKVESSGGEMLTEISPRYKLKVSVNKERGEWD